MKLRELRKAKGLTLRELAQRAKLSPMALSLLERNLTKTPHLLTVLSVSRALGVRPDEIDEFRDKAREIANGEKRKR